MSDHDPLCDEVQTDVYFCICDVLARARADERERQEDGWAARLNSTVAWAENGVRADLRARVEALPSPLEVPGERSRWVLRVDVLALLEGVAR